MQTPPRFERSALYYYLAARLIESAEGPARETTEISRRARERKSATLLNVSDKEFTASYRLTKEAFNYLCSKLREHRVLKSSKRISLELKVLCALSFYATGSYQTIVGQVKHIAQTTVSKFIREVTDALLSPEIMNSFIKFPNTRAQRDSIKNRFFAKYGFPGVVGCIDGSHFHIFTPKKEVEHLFYSRKHFYSLNVQMICDSECRILNINAKYGGATHDAFIWENSFANNFMQSLHRNNEQVWLLAMKRKQEQQMTNRQNFIQGHQMKVSRLQQEQATERQKDDETIREALEGLRRERQKKIDEMHKLKMEKDVFVENYNRERRIASTLEEEAERMALELQRETENKIDQYLRSQEEEKRIIKMEAANEYKNYLQIRKQELEKEREERHEKMERVKRKAVDELQRQLDSANGEMRRQIEYRNSLNKQIMENQRVMDNELNEEERKQHPFTRKPQMFKAAMEARVDKSISEASTNPVHPFQRMMKKSTADHVSLPVIGKNNYNYH